MTALIPGNWPSFGLRPPIPLFFTITMGLYVILDSTPRLGFQLVPDLTPGKNSIHVDFIAENREIAVADLEALGATVQSVQSLPDSEFMWTVMKDPEGNVFCVSDQEH